MKVFDIKPLGYFIHEHSVVADNMAQAERIFLEKYPESTIQSITLHTEYVQVQGFDEQAVMSNWISVKDRLPEDINLVLILNVWKMYELGYYHKLHGWIAQGVSRVVVTHWMPLPEPPKEPTDD